jgi:hypothetical protein
VTQNSARLDWIAPCPHCGTRDLKLYRVASTGTLTGFSLFVECEPCGAHDRVQRWNWLASYLRADREGRCPPKSIGWV